MATLVTVYWACFGIGLAWLLLAGALGAISHGLAGLHSSEKDESGSRAWVPVPAQRAYNPFSLLSIMGTLAGFGGGGVLACELGLKQVASALCAIAGAALMAAALWLIIGKLLSSLHSSGTSHLADMVGLEAEVLTPVEQDSSGEIAYILDGTRYTAPARLLHGGVATKASKVLIRKVGDSLVYVEEQRESAA